MQTTDPVCGKFIVDTEDKGVVKQQFEGHGYYFCSEECKQEFLKNPDKYRNKLAS